MEKKIEQLENRISFKDRYLFNLQDDILSSLKLMYFDSLTLEEISEERGKKYMLEHSEDLNFLSLSHNPVTVKPTPRSKINDKKNENDISDSESNKDFIKYNEKRKERNLEPISEEDFEKIMDQLSLSGSETEPSEDETGGILDNKDSKSEDITKDHVNTKTSNIVPEGQDSSISFLNTRSPFVLLKSADLPDDFCYGLYKTTVNALSPKADPLGVLKQWNKPENKSKLADKMSALFMIGGGHFAGAIISHKPIETKGNKGTQQELELQSVSLLQHKTYHRYTTRRKQGGSQSTMDNSKGKAKSAGSTLRRYNEQELTKDVRDLLSQWKPLLDRCENIFIKASGATSHKTLIGYSDAPIATGDPRIKAFPFTTKRPTTSEIKRAWCELTHLHIMKKPAADTKTREKLLKLQRSLENSKQTNSNHSVNTVEETENEKYTNELISLLKKSKAPALINYVKKKKLSPNFQFEPSSKYFKTPTMLHYASANGFSHMCLILLKNLKADPTIKNAAERTAFELANQKQTEYNFQIARNDLGESYCNWEDAGVPQPMTKEQVDGILKETLDNEEQEKEALMEQGLKEAKEKIKEDKLKRFGQPKYLNGGLSNVVTEEMNLNSLTPEQKIKVMREQRARAAEARMKKLAK
ncbi:unnamed protein product [[Candida] boidinii]|uniref:Unnamed protein product n=1 Tax=Candida boidinii TaxID=5477 RepID=A0A9W6SV97_CANBO|nr:hypothetical protein B5S30_g2628 [[Candida] boidinii]GME67092.1 unnamed protein product [[Candida] boidinii]